jgi:hypothetical protein
MSLAAVYGPNNENGLNNPKMAGINGDRWMGGWDGSLLRAAGIEGRKGSRHQEGRRKSKGNLYHHLDIIIKRRRWGQQDREQRLEERRRWGQLTSPSQKGGSSSSQEEDYLIKQLRGD